MAHFPFSGNANRVSVWAFFEYHRLSMPLQEAYYAWWHDWAKAQVMADPGLRETKGPEFAHFPFGQHAHHEFHLHQYGWATPMLDLGKFIQGTLLPRMSEHAVHELEASHKTMVAALGQRATEVPRAEPPAVGYLRHT